MSTPGSAEAGQVPKIHVGPYPNDRDFANACVTAWTLNLQIGTPPRGWDRVPLSDPSSSTTLRRPHDPGDPVDDLTGGGYGPGAVHAEKGDR